MTDPKPDSLTQFHSAESLRDLISQTVAARISFPASEIVDDSMFQLAEIIELRARDFYENVLTKDRTAYPTMAHVIDALVSHIMEGEG